MPRPALRLPRCERHRLLVPALHAPGGFRVRPGATTKRAQSGRRSALLAKIKFQQLLQSVWKRLQLSCRPRRLTLRQKSYLPRPREDGKKGPTGARSAASAVARAPRAGTPAETYAATGAAASRNLGPVPARQTSGRTPSHGAQTTLHAMPQLCRVQAARAVGVFEGRRLIEAVQSECSGTLQNSAPVHGLCKVPLWAEK